MEPFRKSSILLFGVFLLLIIISENGCGSIIAHYSQPLFDDISSSFMEQKDIVLVKAGLPAYLITLDGLIKHDPENKSLLLTGARAYSAYSYAFVGDKHPERYKILTKKARDYAFRAFSLHDRRFEETKNKPYSEFVTYVSSLEKRDVPYLFYVANTWAGWIQANVDSWEAIAELPRVQVLMERVIELDENFFYASPHTFIGVLLIINPPSLGGRPEEARRHFERAIEIGKGVYLPAYVMYAKYYAKMMYNKELFFNLLNKVLESPVDKVPELTFINVLAQQQAKDLKDTAIKEKYFD